MYAEESSGSLVLQGMCKYPCVSSTGVFAAVGRAVWWLGAEQTTCRSCWCSHTLFLIEFCLGLPPSASVVLSAEDPVNSLS